MPQILIDATRKFETEVGPWGGKEFVPCNPNNPLPFTTTRQFWNPTNPKQWVTYNVIVQIEEGNPTEIHIDYNGDGNPHLPPRIHGEIEWGEHILVVQQGANMGPSTWIDANGNEYEGPGWTSIGIVGEHRRETTTRLQRKQAEFREMLLASDGSCAITGEACHDVLEAAHIVAARDGGQEILENGILLRADLHRLYDANPPKFEICPETGQISIAEGFNYEGFDLNGRQVKEAILQRVNEALNLR